MLIEYLRRSRVFRVVFAWPLKIRQVLLRGLKKNPDDVYRTTVAGGRIIVRPSNISGEFEISAVSDIARRIVVTGEFESNITENLRCFFQLRGDVINVGANVGFYPVFVAGCFPYIERIVAIEPNPEAFEFLKKNLAVNACEQKILTIQACIGAEAGTVELSTIIGKPEYSSIREITHPSTAGAAQELIEVEISTLDEVVQQNELHPSLVIIDTEGAEYFVLEGAMDTIREHAPIIVFECDDRLLRKFGHTSEGIEKLIVSMGYVVRDAINPAKALVHPFVGEAIAVPTDRIDLLSE